MDIVQKFNKMNTYPEYIIQLDYYFDLKGRQRASWAGDSIGNL